MTSLASVSQSELVTRRQKLRHLRRIRAVQSIWRSLVLCGLAGGLVWITTTPEWVIRKPEQIAIEGNRMLSGQAIRSFVPLSYPQSLWRLQPQEIAEKLQAQAPIAHATVTRQLLPPGLTIQVKERQPVAIAQPLVWSTHKHPSSDSATGLLDEQGIWIPMEKYTALNSSVQLPTLKVIGSVTQYSSYWPGLYRAVSHSPVKVYEIDCREPANLILKTELGNVHFGSYSSRFAYQLSTLDRMRELPTRLRASQIAYIDLKNPDNPSIKMIKINVPVKQGSP